MVSELNEEQQMLQDAVRRYMRRSYDFAARTQSVESSGGTREAVWSWLEEMGLLALPFDQQHGGLDGTNADIALVMREMGRGLMVEPWLDSVVIAGGLLARLGNADQCADWLTPLIEGKIRLALAHQEGADWAPQRLHTRAQRDSDGRVRLYGRKTSVPFGAQVDLLIVSARDADAGAGDHTAGSDTAEDATDAVLYVIARDAPGVTCRDYPMQDGRRGAEVLFDGAEVTNAACLEGQEAIRDALVRVREQSIAAICAEAVGAMEALNAMTVEYLQTRKQFGQAIGKFQALQHALADMAIEVEQAISAAQLAQIAITLPMPADRCRLLAAAKARIGVAARVVGRQAVQLHGGMGLSDELAVGHYFKRLTAIDLQFGDADHYLGVFSDAMVSA